MRQRSFSEFLSTLAQKETVTKHTPKAKLQGGQRCILLKCLKGARCAAKSMHGLACRRSSQRFIQVLVLNGVETDDNKPPL